MRRGYFDDFRDFRDNHGKTFASESWKPSAAQPFPPITAMLPDGSTVHLPFDTGVADLTLVAVAFRAGAQDLIELWTVPFSETFKAAPRVRLVELAIVESSVMQLKPFRGILMKSGTASQAKYAMPADYLFHFGKAKPVAAALGLTNRLTGYVFLLDDKGRIRWRSSGSPTGDELARFMDVARQCTGPRPRKLQ